MASFKFKALQKSKNVSTKDMNRQNIMNLRELKFGEGMATPTLKRNF